MSVVLNTVRCDARIRVGWTDQRKIVFRTGVLGSLLGSIAMAAVIVAPNAAADAPDAARLAGCDFGREVSTYDHAHDLDGYFERVLARSTGAFHAEFTESRGALAAAMRQAEVRSTAENITCGAVSGDFLNADVLVTMTQIRSNANTPEPQRLNMVINVKLTNVWGRWLLHELDSPLLK
ncbi:hypothetical protein QX204_08010 [Nocardia sp. PE-7]|uniref:hypothetical protein n=1 Tax=Nocardia sp. PE-7 TaxID=3058426 RepID=UPI00265B390B|nr:hypothetical protein [Nocardia sp. PE-7]WKG11387.1 hypothetical protein QX204_08010 [Nocardia sp. PE-7]